MYIISYFVCNCKWEGHIQLNSAIHSSSVMVYVLIGLSPAVLSRWSMSGLSRSRPVPTYSWCVLPVTFQSRGWGRPPKTSSRSNYRWVHLSTATATECIGNVLTLVSVCQYGITMSIDKHQLTNLRLITSVCFKHYATFQSLTYLRHKASVSPVYVDRGEDAGVWGGGRELEGRSGAAGWSGSSTQRDRAAAAEPLQETGWTGAQDHPEPTGSGTGQYWV